MEERKQTKIILAISFAMVIIIISMFLVGYSNFQKNHTVDNTSDKDKNWPPPVDFYQGRIQGTYSIDEAIDAFEEKAPSLMIRYIFGYDIELAKEKMGDGKYSEFFSKANIFWELLHDYSNEEIKGYYQEVLEIYPDEVQGLKVVLTKNGFAIPHSVSNIITVDDREYYVEKTDEGNKTKYIVDLGGNTEYYFEISPSIENKDEIFKSLLEYGFMLKDSVPNWQENKYEPSTEEPSDKNSAGCRSFVMGGAAVMISAAAIGVLCLSKKRKED